MELPLAHAPVQATAFRGHTRIASLMAPDVGQVVAALGRLDGADAAEIRLDGIWPSVPDPEQAADDIVAILSAAHVPLIATLRPVRQGGRFDGAEAVRVGLLAAAARAGFA
ncbi:MAG: type I 3-dehydroquinate dehydratase, partial [Thermoplasmatota archaeon]